MWKESSLYLCEIPSPTPYICLVILEKITPKGWWGISELDQFWIQLATKEFKFLEWAFSKLISRVFSWDPHMAPDAFFRNLILPL